MSKKRKMIFGSIALCILIFAASCVVGSLYESAHAGLVQSDTVATYTLVAIYTSVTVLAIALFHAEYVKSFKNVEKDQPLKSIIVFSTVALTLNFVLTYILMSFGGGITSNQESIHESASLLPIPVLIITVVCAPIFEETIFRYIFQDWIKNKIGADKKFSAPIAIMCSGLLFGVMHSGISIEIFPYFAIGVVFATAYEKTRSIGVAICAHAANNIVAQCLFYFL